MILAAAVLLALKDWQQGTNPHTHRFRQTLRHCHMQYLTVSRSQPSNNQATFLQDHDTFLQMNHAPQIQIGKLVGQKVSYPKRDATILTCREGDMIVLLECASVHESTRRRAVLLVGF